MSRTPIRHYLVAYDVRQPRRLRRVHRVLKARGLPVQYSVFLCPVACFADVWHQLSREIAAEDDLRAYPVGGLGDLWLAGRDAGGGTGKAVKRRGLLRWLGG